MKRFLIGSSLALVAIIGLSNLSVSANQRTGRQIRNNQQLQQSSISLGINDLQKTTTLKITKVNNLSSGSVTGQIKLGGKTIKTIASNTTELNLSSLLKKGVNVLEISGNYSPNSSSIKIEFAGSNTRISQQTGGNGKINQKLIINVF